MEHILEQAVKVAEQAEVFSLSRRETEALFEANRLKLLQTREISGAALRIIKGGRIGFSATTKRDLGELIPMALEMAPFGAEARFHFPHPQGYAQIDVYDPKTEAVSEAEMVSLGEALISQLREHSPDIVCQAEVVRSVTAINIVNSRGGEASYQRTAFTVTIEGVLIRGTDMLFVGDSESSCHPIADPSAVARTTLWQLEQAHRLAPMPSGRLPVVFTPHGVASALITPLALAFNGKTVLQGASPLGGKRGERVFDPRLSVWDDATIELRPSSRICDDEGVPSQRTPLIADGVVVNFLYDLQTAALAEANSTGNASRALSSLPTPAPSALIIGEGEATFEEMIAALKEGLIVEQLIGAGQGNLLSGEFSGNVLLGFRVHNGEIVGRVKDTMIHGNIYQALRQCVAIGREARWVGSSLETPHLCCPDLAVAAKQQSP